MGETQAPGGPEGAPGPTWPRTLAVARVSSGARVRLAELELIAAGDALARVMLTAPLLP